MVLDDEAIHHVFDSSNALVDRDRRSLPSHVGLDPPGVDHDRHGPGTAPLRTSLAELVVQRSLRVPITAETSRATSSSTHL